MDKERVSAGNVLRFAGAVVAFVIGSGFATGQEVLRFFTVYGVWGVWGQMLTTLILSLCCAKLMEFGYDNRSGRHNPYYYFCGPIFGRFMEYFTPVFSFFMLVVMVSGAGATLNQYLGVPHLAGRLSMAAITALVTVFGLRKLMNIIGFLGPFTILITLVIGLITLFKSFPQLSDMARQIARTPGLPYSAGTGPGFWPLSAVLYAAFNLNCAIPFMTEMGATANSRSEAAIGGALGGGLLMLSALAINLAQMCAFQQVLPLEIPTLRLAELISPALGTVFVLVLLGEIFSTAAPLLWTAANKINGTDGSFGNRAAVLAVITAAFAGSAFPFGGLVGTVYPLSGYVGAGLVLCVMAAPVREKYAALRR